MSARGIHRIVMAFAAMLFAFSCRGAGGLAETDDSPVKSITIGAEDMRYIHFGNRNGEKIVILPGLSLKRVTGSADAIIAAYGVLAENYDIWLFDHIQEEPEGYTIADMAEDTLAAFDRLGLEQVHLMGFSMGGMTAQTIAVKAPERVLSLILCSTAMNTMHSEPDVFDRWKELAEAKDTPALMEAFGESVYTPAFYEQYKDVIIASGDGATELDYRNFLISPAAVRAFDDQEAISGISCPALVLGAGSDRVLGVQAAYDLAGALNCPYYIYEGYGHGVYDEAPDYLFRINDFLRDCANDPD